MTVGSGNSYKGDLLDESPFFLALFRPFFQNIFFFFRKTR
ncbi:hypothetical protein SaSA75_0630 [Streptococcus agalactiae]|nr:hypothetical protein SaSA75_0630 [Streptococcus agalactiae]AUO99940.1 hypothetical protein SaSA95_0628 [Streptococcus agalactiae]AUP01611.1 hypothetical protein SaSA97_0631 [Streptococcus agalactiae]AUP04711.1 hypothetical protein SaSA132_0629 [Streptococcus agalactiae]AUP06371.1 hypothetical protein SaSA136_0631 [Streptococcus agalactiae]